ncbi:hypothetical protein M0802_004255 [Mischocyttarus mexicanus]|nr:hypothetical protein M0802_004255 [Mischocyttarus mexicanus]
MVLAFLLADEGYDVWVGNYRGNTYSRSHVNMTTDDPNFWKFSYHDMGLYDIPQSIDYILNYTKSKKLFFIGHSMGTTSSYVMLSTKQSYNNKMRLVISLAPTSYFKEKFPPYLDTISKLVPLVKTMFDEQGIYEVLPQSRLFKLIGLNFCNKNSIFLSICTEIIYRISGRDTEQLNESILPFIWTYVPAGSSFQAVYHYYQNYVTGNFEAYDYGYEDNLIHYKTPKPPTYKVNKIVAPVALIYGINDVLTSEKSVKVLTKKLSNVVTCEAVPYKNFGHLDFIIANDVKSLVFDRILQLMKDF